jgi:N-acetylglucosaminyldiphosphoundecaprenol N-acetyl-beta-D-mannosaminyltransferase
MQWLHRLLQDPRRLWKRYFRNNPAFLWHIALQLSGMRQYPHTSLEYLPAPPLDAEHPLQADSPLATSRTQLQQLGS